MESQKREGRRRLIAVFPIQRVVERGVSLERIGGGMGGGMRSREEGEGAGNQPGTRRGEEGVETRSRKRMGSRMWREARGEGTRRSRWVVCRESGGKGRREGIDGSGKRRRVENVGGGGRGGVKRRERSSGGLSVGE